MHIDKNLQDFGLPIQIFLYTSCSLVPLHPPLGFSSARMHVLYGPGSMLKSGISHSKSCSSGRRDGLRKSLDNHVFLLIYSKYLDWKQI